MISVLVAGDYCPHGRITNLVEQGDYDTIFGQVKSTIEQCDYSLVNFECPVSTSNSSGIVKNGPVLGCSPKSVESIKYAGFKAATLANNHFYDQGENGVKETIASLNKSGIAYVGGGHNIHEASSVLFADVQGKTLAVINCCEHEFSIATEKTGGANPLEPIRQYYAIKNARSKADYVLVIVHGGIEHYQYPTGRMVDTYRFFIDAGADAVVNHHQHCFSGSEIYKGKPIFYGLGNFCFDWKERSTSLWIEGYMVKLLFDGDKVGFKLFPYIQNSEHPGVRLQEGKRYEKWKTSFDDISSIIADKEKLEDRYQELLGKTERWYSTVLTPYDSRLMRVLYRRGFLPMLFSRRKLVTLLNLLMCESHYDRMIKMLINYTKRK